MLAEKIATVRQKNKLTQEEIAEKLGISRQSVQKWESGLSYPSIDKLVSLSKLLNVSIDYLCKDENYVDSDAGRVGGELRPQYKSIHEWELYSKTLPIEYRQCIDEGLDAEAYKGLFFAARENAGRRGKRKSFGRDFQHNAKRKNKKRLQIRRAEFACRNTSKTRRI